MSESIEIKVKQDIEKTSYTYRFFHSFLNNIYRTFYKKVVILGKENIPRGEPFFVTPNHQNSMMDAMAILFTIGRPNPVFMARADIFKNKFVAKILFFFKLLPIYRIRDGKDSLQKNERIFQQTIDIVSKGVPLIIYPEGNHDGHRRFRGVKKGIIRTAFTAVEQFDEGKKLYFVPVGIDYNMSYEKAMQTIIVFYGKPLLVNDFHAIYKEDKAKGERQLQLALQERMPDQMIHISNLEYYDFYDIVREVACGEVMMDKGVKRDPEQKLYVQQDIIKVLDKAFEKDGDSFVGMQEKALKYKGLMSSFNLREWLFDKEKHSLVGLLLESLLALLLLPIAVYGRLTNGLQFMLIDKMAEKNKDPQWKSSVRFLVSLSLLPISHLVLTLLSLLIFDHNAWSLLVLFSLIFTASYSFPYEVWVKKIRGRFRYNRLQKEKNASFRELLTLRNELISFVKKAMA